MNMNNTTWFEIFITFGFGLALIFIVALLIAFINPHIDQQGAVKGGQILHTPGHLNSCIYPAK